MGMIIDIHTHPVKYRPAGESLTPEESVEHAVSMMDRAGISMCGLLGYDVFRHQRIESVRAVNIFTESMVRLAPKKFFGLCFVNPLLPKVELEDELERCLSMGIFLGIKLECDVNCLDPSFEMIMEKAENYNVPILQHSWHIDPRTSSADDNHISTPGDISELARRYPGVNIIMAHMEGVGLRGILDVAQNENVYIDTSGSQPFSGTLEFALREVGSERILFGSDFFYRSYAAQLGRILGTKMPAPDRNRILADNAIGVFNLNLQKGES